jgi:pyridoxal phosphate enzyme (YggS family)
LHPNRRLESGPGTVHLMVGSRDEILANVEAIGRQIERSCERVARDPGQVTLVAAAKTVPTEVIRWVVDAGVTAVGENYVNELRLAHDEVPGATWHYIGAMQTNSAHHVAALADVVESLSGDRSTERLARRSEAAGRTLDALIEVDFTGERSGVEADEVVAFADRVAPLAGLRLRGLMTVPPLSVGSQDARRWFIRLRELRDRVREKHPGVVDLSMGMSLDYEAAVEEGATMVRIGTALFGSRTPR